MTIDLSDGLKVIDDGRPAVILPDGVRFPSPEVVEASLDLE